MTLPCLEVDTRCSSTFKMIKKSYKARLLLNAVSERVPELQNVNSYEADWEISKNICKFLYPSTQATEIHLGSKYITISVTTRTFENMLKICNMSTSSNDAYLIPIVHAMNLKLEHYSMLVKSPISLLYRALDSLIRSDVITDSRILGDHIPLPEVSSAEYRDPLGNENNIGTPKKFLFLQAFHYNSQNFFDD